MVTKTNLIFVSLVSLIKSASEFTCGAAQVECEATSCDVDGSVGHRLIQEEREIFYTSWIPGALKNCHLTDEESVQTFAKIKDITQMLLR